MPITKMQLIGLVVIAAVATTAITIFVVVDPFAPEYTLTIEDPATTSCTTGGNVTVTPARDCTFNYKDPCQFKFKKGTEVTLTIHLTPGSDLYIRPWGGLDAASVVTVEANKTYTIIMTKDMNISVVWYIYCS